MPCTTARPGGTIVTPERSSPMPTVMRGSDALGGGGCGVGAGATGVVAVVSRAAGLGGGAGGGAAGAGGRIEAQEASATPSAVTIRAAAAGTRLIARLRA